MPPTPAAEVQGAVGYCVSAVLATESDASDASDSSDVSDVSDTADSSDASDTSDPSDSSETSDPTDPASGCADPLAVNQNTPIPVPTMTSVMASPTPASRLAAVRMATASMAGTPPQPDAEVFIATTGERFITALIDDGEARFLAPSMATTRHGSPIETTVSALKAESTRNGHSATFRQGADGCNGIRRSTRSTSTRAPHLAELP